MTFLSGAQPLRKLQHNRGGFYYLEVDAETVAQLPEKHKTRIICTLEQTLKLRCGLNHLGDGNFYVLLAQRHIKNLNKNLHDLVAFNLEVDPDPLGVDIPEVLTELLHQDSEARNTFNLLAHSRKRTLIHRVNRIKNIDIQVRQILDFLEEEAYRIHQRKNH
ncbi:MAG: YdeI/OmpD-associated family protein [Flavobacteriaceae bacterium]